jgi:hypothetical protein
LTAALELETTTLRLFKLNKLCFEQKFQVGRDKTIILKNETKLQNPCGNLPLLPERRAMPE